jgi:hypothetical protein
MSKIKSKARCQHKYIYKASYDRNQDYPYPTVTFECQKCGNFSTRPMLKQEVDIWVKYKVAGKFYMKYVDRLEELGEQLKAIKYLPKNLYS